MRALLLLTSCLCLAACGAVSFLASDKLDAALATESKAEHAAYDAECGNTPNAKACQDWALELKVKDATEQHVIDLAKQLEAAGDAGVSSDAGK